MNNNPLVADGAVMETAVAPRRRLPKTFAALRHRNFALYFVGQLISAIGTWMQIIAEGWLVYQLSRSELMLGLVGFCAAIPALFLSPWGGVVIDRVSKRNLLVITQTGSMLLAFTLSALILTGNVQIWHVLVLATLLGVIQAFDAPARQAFTVEMVEREDLANAVALNAMVFNGARFVGPAVGGILLALVGAGWCYLINGFSFLAVIACLLLMQVPKFEKPRIAESSWQQLRSGASYVKHHQEILGIILLALSLCIFGVSFVSVMPAYVDKVLHAGESAYGNLTAAQGLGALMGAIILATYGDRIPRGKALAIANFGFPIVLFALAFTTWYPLALVWMFLLGVTFLMQFNNMNVLIQLRVDDAIRGRVMSLYTLTFFGVSPFGNLLTGWLSEYSGLSVALGLCAALTFVCVSLIHSRVPQIRQQM